MEPMLVSTRFSSGIGEVIIDRPQRLNALNTTVRQQLSQAVAALEREPELRAIVLRGSGPRAFAAGADVDELVGLSALESERLSLSIMDFHERLRSLPAVTVAAIEGWCLGGGLELALACDIRLASTTARLGLPEVTLAITPGGGGLARLVRLVGASNARALCLTGESINAERALAIGLVWRVIEADQFEAEVAKLAGRLAGYSATALHQLKSALDIAEHADLASAQRAEAKACALCFGTPEQRGSMQKFLDQRR